MTNDVNILFYTKDSNSQPKIFLPTEMLNNTIQWYHLALGHIGQKRLIDTISTHLYHPMLQERVTHFVSSCPDCQKAKNILRGHGHLAPREASAHPWREVAVDLIGPWSLKIGDKETSFSALTVIDTVTNLVELICIDNKSSSHFSRQFEMVWLSRYSRPLTCIYDQGGEFGICKRMHQTVGNILWTMQSMQLPKDIKGPEQMIETCTAIHGALKASPGLLTFGRDMILDIPLLADWKYIQDNCQQIIDK